MTTTKLSMSEKAEALRAAGLTVREWTGGTDDGLYVRLYVSDRGKPLGFVSELDDGSTGSGRGLRRRAGYVMGILREAAR